MNIIIKLSKYKQRLGLMAMSEADLAITIIINKMEELL